MKNLFSIFKKKSKNFIITESTLKTPEKEYSIQGITDVKKIKVKNKYLINIKWLLIFGITPLLASYVFYYLTQYSLYYTITTALLCWTPVYYGIRERRKKPRKYAVQLANEFGKLELISSTKEAFIEELSQIIKKITRGEIENPYFEVNLKTEEIIKITDENSVQIESEEVKSLEENIEDPEKDTTE